MKKSVHLYKRTSSVHQAYIKGYIKRTSILILFINTLINTKILEYTVK